MIGENSLERFILDSYLHGIVFFDKKGIVQYSNKLFEEITHIQKDELIGRSIKERLFSCLDENKVSFCGNCPFIAGMETKQVKRVSCFISNRSGYLVPVIITTIPIFNGNEFIGTVFDFEDNTSKFLNYRKMRQLEELAMLDPLTGLPNRRFLNDMLDRCFQKLERFADYNFAIVFIDIDNFKIVNDRFGHDKGDYVLKKLSEIIKESLRQYDVITRYGGEEFVLILQYISMEMLFQVCDRLREKVENNLRIPGSDHKITVSLGATFATKKDTKEQLIERADKLMYKSKLEGKNKVNIG